MQDRPFSDLHKEGVPLVLCMHLLENGIEKGLSLQHAVWTVRQSKSGFSIGNKLRNCSKARKRRGGKEGGLSE